MTRNKLAAALRPITRAALDTNDDPDVQMVSVILAAVMGCIDGGETDRQALIPLAETAGRICEHRTGKHG